MAGVCVECLMTNRGAPNTSTNYSDKECWSVTELMAAGGALLLGNEKDMFRSRNRLKTKLPTDGPGQYTGPSITEFQICTNHQKRLVLYHKLYRFLYGVGRKGVRVVLPSCCIMRIQNTWPDPAAPATIDESFIEDTIDNGIEDVPVVINHGKRKFHQI